MAKIGYARVSSKEQHLDRQLAALKDVDKLFTDKLSGANTNRPELQKMLAYIREGDIVMVTELDRLGRNNHDLTKIMNSIQNKGATLDVLNLPSMTGIADPNLRQLMTNLIIELYKYQAVFSTLSQVLSTILSNFILKYRPNREMAPGESS